MNIISSQFLKNLALVLGSMLFVLVVFELFLRLFSPQIFDVHPRGMYVPNQDVGYVLATDFEGYIEREEFKSRISINDSGLRGQAPAVNSDGVSRILVLGDSLSFGFGVEEDETFSVVLERCLNGIGQGSYEVLNAGVPGYGTIDQLNFLRSRGAGLAPDLVILQFLSDNDLDENRYPATEWADVEDGWLVSRNYDPASLLPLWKRAEYWLKANFHSVQFLSGRVGYLVLKSGLFPSMEQAVWGERFGAEEEELFEQALIGIKQEVEGLGADLLLIYGTGQGQVLSSEDPALRSEALVSRVAAAQEVELANAFRRMREHEGKYSFYYPVDGHWNATGHRFIGELLCEAVSSRR